MADRSETLIEHLKPPAGITMTPYPASHDLWYRRGLWAYAIALVGIAAAMSLGHHRLTDVLLTLAALANLMAAWMFLVWMPLWRWIVRGLAVLAIVGVGIQDPLWIWVGILAATAVMAQKEYHCFKFGTGPYIPWVSLAAGLASQLRVDWIAAILLLGLAGCWFSLLWQRAALPLFQIDGNA